MYKTVRQKVRIPQVKACIREMVLSTSVNPSVPGHPR